MTATQDHTIENSFIIGNVPAPLEWLTLLERGLKFIPTPNTWNHHIWTDEVGIIHKSTQNTGTNTTTIHTGDSESQTSETRRRISLDTYRDRSTHNVEITYSRHSTRVVVQNATGDWRNSIRDLHALMKHKIPSQDPVDINLRLDPYQSSTATSFDTESSEMAGTGYGTIHASDNSARTQTDYPADEHPQYEEYKWTWVAEPHRRCAPRRRKEQFYSFFCW